MQGKDKAKRTLRKNNPFYKATHLIMSRQTACHKHDKGFLQEFTSKYKLANLILDMNGTFDVFIRIEHITKGIESFVIIEGLKADVYHVLKQHRIRSEALAWFSNDKKLFENLGFQFVC